MPRVPEVPAEPDEPEGALSPQEGPLPPGAPVEDTDEETPTKVEDLRVEAEARGVMPNEGSGKGGRVVKADLEEALASAPPEPPMGRPPLSMVAEQSAAQIMPWTDEEE